jgi:hypothetical protein
MKYISFILIILFLSSCADTQTVDACMTGYKYGFFAGVWHGFILVFSLIGSLIFDDIAIYATNNNGFFYNFGFWLGSVIYLPKIYKKK